MKSIFSTFLILTQISYGVLTIEYNFDDSVSAENRTVFNQAKVFWENVITGYVDGIDRTLVITANTFSQDITGGGTLGSASPRTLDEMANGLSITTVGFATFNVDPTATGGTGIVNQLVIRHEIGHVLGIGTLWGLNQLYGRGTGEYIGVNGLAGFNQEFGLNASFIPVELDGGAGTAEAHFNEAADNPFDENASGPDTHPGDSGVAPTVISGPNQGRSFDEALFSGILSPNAFLSDSAIGSLRDLGFTTIDFRSNATAVPEPSVSIFLALGLGSLLLQRKRNR